MKLLDLKSKEGLFLKKDMLGRYFLMKKTNEINILNEERDNFIYHSSIVNENGGTYESIEVSGSFDEEFIYNLFDFLCTLKKSLKNSINLIENFFNNSYEIGVNEVRGLFAELVFIQENENLKINHQSSIYDFELNGNEYEIKSMSSTNVSVKISFQQAFNSSNAILVVYEIYESIDGISVKELFKKLGISSMRYSWIQNNKNQLLNKKFKVKKTYRNNMFELFSDVKLNKNIINAVFDVIVKM